jgi:hypothetical protein
MAKKAVKKASKPRLHHKLEQPVHNVLGYTVLLALAVVVFFIVYGLQLSGSY